MSIVLSIYSQKGFREVTLPEHGQAELQILLQKELFVLDQDITLELERQEQEWTLRSPDARLLGSMHYGEAADTRRKVEAMKVSGGTQIEVATRGGNRITILAFEQTNPFTVYRKFSLTGLQRIRIGRNPENEVCYRNVFVGAEHCVITIQGGKATLRDHSKNGTYLNFHRVYGNTVLQYGDSIRIMRLNIIYLGSMIAVDECDDLTIKINQITGADLDRYAHPGQTGGEERVLFHRSPRDLRKLHTEPFEIEAPPNPQEHQDPPLMMQIGPTLTMSIPMVLGTALSIWASRSTGTSSGAFMYMGMITAISSALIGSLWAVANIRQAGRLRRQSENRRFESYSEYLIRMRDRIERAYAENITAMKERYLSALECSALDEHSALLWNRNASHDDYLSVRLGMGDVPFQAEITIPKERFTMINDSLADKPQVIRENFQMLRDVPVTVDLLEHRLIGIAGGGSRKAAISIAKAMMAQIATANCYTDVKIAVVYDENNDIDRDAWDFAMWLPHVWSGDKKIRYIATNKTEKGDVFYALTQVLRIRSDEDGRARVLRPRFVLFVADPTLLDGEPISHYVFSRGADLGLSTVLLTGQPEELPNECECIIENDGRFQGIYDTKDGRSYGTKVKFDHVADESLGKLAKTLGRIEVVEAEQDGEIPNTLTFFDMYGVSRPEELNAAERWKKSNSIATMRALVGFRNGNTPCYLDINEKYHGPHGLVAGTTGSGKSETLQTYILSLAVNFSPEDIGFFIIDYKGGGMANLFDNLPHMIGSISNLSGNQVKRAMVSIQSENRRRQRIFTEYGVNNINGYTALFKNGDAAEPIPHLFIIIDEFAELKREEPEFMKELISVAQVGRSLGVHLILSTQRPSGTVDENIWANSKFRLCLRVQDRQDSMDMLHRPEAAYLTQSGRCYLQVGNDEIFELFQSGWSGADYDEELGGGSLLIAQMLSATGKVDLAGNRAKIKRKEELRRKWVGRLAEVLRDTEAETGISEAEPGFSFQESREFRTAFYARLRAAQPDFEENQANDARIQDFCVLYCRAAAAGDTGAESIVRQAEQDKKRRLPEVRTKTQLEVTSSYLSTVTESLKRAGRMREIQKLWLPVLPEYLYLEDLEGFHGFDGISWPERPRRFQLNAVIGMADDPENQAQIPVSVDFALGGHHMLIGTVSTGKSTFMQTVINSLAFSYTPDLLNIYCLDFSAKMLSVFADLKHVGGYLDESDLDTDHIGKFFTMISRILDERKAKFAGTSFEDAMNHNGWTVPAILIVIDNYGSFHEKTGEAYETVMTRIAKEGNGYGVFLLVSAGGIGMQELPSRLAETFRTGIALEMPDPFAYADVLRVVRPSVLPESRVKGRGLLYYGDRILEFQTALSARAEGGPERNDLIKAAVARMNEAWTGPRARSIPRIPDHPVRADLTALPEYAEALNDPAKMPVGYDFETADVYSLDLAANYVFLVTGAKQSGKTVFMENLILTAAGRGDEIFVANLSGEEGSAYTRIAADTGAKLCTDGAGILETLTFIQQEMIRRADIKRECLARKASDREMFDAALVNRRIDLFIGDIQPFVAEIENRESPAIDARNFFETLCEKGKGYNIFLYAEVQDRDQSGLMGYTSFDSLRSFQSGIRFGGRFGEQKIFSFENVGFRDADRGMKPGTGVIPCDNREAPLVKVVIPAS